MTDSFHILSILLLKSSYLKPQQLMSLNEQKKIENNWAITVLCITPEDGREPRPKHVEW